MKRFVLLVFIFFNSCYSPTENKKPNVIIIMTDDQGFGDLGINENPNIIINCTPLGMWPKINSMPDIEINNQSTLIETVYNPLETKWLKYGKEIGAKTISGLDMFIWQGIASIELWLGEKISEKIELEKVKKVLKSELC